MLDGFGDVLSAATPHLKLLRYVHQRNLLRLLASSGFDTDGLISLGIFLSDWPCIVESLLFVLFNDPILFIIAIILLFHDHLLLRNVLKVGQLG